MSSEELLPLVVCGPSGVGKGTIMARLQQRFEGAFAYSVSHTTRQPRQGEKDGVNYHFIELDQMKDMIANHRFIEHANVHGNLYGTSFSGVEDVQQQQKKICILEIDVQGAQQVYDHKMAAHYLFVRPPSIEALRERLLGRKSESEDSLKLRLHNAEHELAVGESAPFFEKTLVNENLEEAVQELFSIVLDWYPCLQKTETETFAHKTEEDIPA